MDAAYFTDMSGWRSMALLTVAVGQTLFVSMYAWWPWWKNFLGRALFFKSVSLMALADIGLAGRAFDWPHEDLTFTCIYWALAGGVWWQFFAFYRVRAAHRAVSGNPDEPKVTAP